MTMALMTVGDDDNGDDMTVMTVSNDDDSDDKLPLTISSCKQNKAMIDHGSP